jgi:hypothetical protein
MNNEYCRNCGMDIRRQNLKLMCACGFVFCSVKCNKEYHLKNGDNSEVEN